VKQLRIAVMSCAFTGNFGDDIGFEGVLRRIPDILPQKVNGKVTHFLRITKESVDAINQHDYFLIGGGELFSNSDVLDQLTKNKVTIPYGFVSVGVGNKNDLTPLKSLDRPFYFSVRTKSDAEICREAGIKNVKVKPDLLRACPYFEVQLQNGPAIAVCLKNTHKSAEWIRAFARELDIVLSLYKIPVVLVAFSSMNQQKIEYGGEKILIGDCNDLELAHNINCYMRNKVPIVYYKDRAMDFLTLMSTFKGIVSERLHGTIAAYHTGVPFRSIPYHTKVNKFLKEVDMENREISSSPEVIVSAITELWDGSFKEASEVEGEKVK